MVRTSHSHHRVFVEMIRGTKVANNGENIRSIRPCETKYVSTGVLSHREILNENVGVVVKIKAGGGRVVWAVAHAMDELLEARFEY